MTDDLVRELPASNAFDRMRVDVAGLYARYPLAARRDWPGSPPPFLPIYSAPLPLRVRLAAWKLLHRVRLDERWVTRFAAYWVDILGGRPMMSADDFHFLRGIYRIRHQGDGITDTNDAATHVGAWQQRTMIYQVFAQQFFESIDPRLAEAHWLRRLRVKSFIEFGAASAPVTTAYRQFFGGDVPSTIVDIETVAFHYAAFKFKNDPHVTPITLSVQNDLLPPADLKADAIVCKATFEHLKDPLEIARRFAAQLNPGGYLIFDYLHSEGDGLDTMHGVRQRDAVLDFIDQRFSPLHGTARQHRGSQLTVARLR
ncbi:MAG TPA: methyltransferase domain-containing protein [Vicinamibacterales bacterium]|nr:methyltransferase domain-containing protein [Vicinamibacterales bacterium]